MMLSRSRMKNKKKIKSLHSKSFHKNLNLVEKPVGIT